MLLFCRTSLQYGISCLKRLNYDRNLLDERRKNAENANADVIVWSNDRLIRWVANIGLKVCIGHGKNYQILNLCFSLL